MHKKRILFVITSFKISNTGFGGHYYSLLTYVEVLKPHYDITVFHFSELDKTILDSSLDRDVTYIKKSNSCNIDIKKIQPDVIVFFGASGVETHLLRIKARALRIPIVGLKQGGANPNKIYPYYDHIICFSKENFSWFNKKYHFRHNSQIHLLPNRISKTPLNNKRLQNFPWIQDDHINILRLSRISKSYYDSFVKTINLHMRLLQRNMKVNTVLIGNPQDKEIVKSLKKYIQNTENINLLTSKEYTDHAKELIPLFDIVTGIGRVFMEAAAEKKIVLGFSSAYEIPIIVDEDNYESFKELNFSMRNKWKNGNESIEFEKILVAINNPTKMKKTQKFIHEKFSLDYDAEMIVDYFEIFFKSNSMSFIAIMKDNLNYIRRKTEIIKDSFYGMIKKNIKSLLK